MNITTTAHMPPGLSALKWAIWLYVLLIIFEGALRKWLLPGFAAPLLVVRDPVAAYILVQGLRLRLLPQTPLFFASFIVGIAAILLAMVFGHGNPYVALYGARPFFLHLPAMFVMALALDRDDLIRIGKFVLLVSLGMTVLIAVQFYSPQTAWVNRGVSGEGSSAGFSGALGYYRPPGTYSFTSGVAQFYSLQGAFLLYFWLNPKGVRRALLLAATIALIVALPLSISRTLLFQSAIAIAFAAVAASLRPKLLRRGVIVVFSAGLIFMLASSFGFFQTPLEVIQTRFTQAAISEGGLEGTLVDRYLGGLWKAVTRSDEWPFWGMGIGMGTNVGAALLSGGGRAIQFLVAEEEWQRQVGELGLLLGLMVIGMRLWITGKAAAQSWGAMMRGDVLPWMLLANALTLLPQGSWNQPTALGFSILSGGLLLASLRHARVSSRLHPYGVAPSWKVVGSVDAR